MQEVQTFTRWTSPPSLTRAFWRLGFQMCFVRLWEWLTLHPVP